MTVVFCNQGVFGLGIFCEFAVALVIDGIASIEELVLGGAEAGPEFIVHLAWSAAGGLPFGHQIAVGAGGGTPIGRILDGLGSLDELFFLFAGNRTGAVQLGKVGAAAAVEGIAGARVALPQGIIGLTVDTLNLLPLLQDGADAVASGLPLGGVFSNFFCFSRQLFLGSDCFFAATLLIGLRLLAGFYRVFNHRAKAPIQGSDVSDDRSSR